MLSINYHTFFIGTIKKNFDVFIKVYTLVVEIYNKWFMHKGLSSLQKLTKNTIFKDILFLYKYRLGYKVVLMGIFNAVSEIAGKCRVWSHAKVVRKCEQAGHEFVKMAKANDGKLTIEQLNGVYGRISPKGCKINAVSDPQSVESFLRGMNLGEDVISAISTTAQAIVMNNFKGERLFFLPIEKLSGDKAVNLATHEFEHALKNETTLRAKVGELIVKALGVKWCEKLALKDGEAVNLKLMKLQQDLVGRRLGIADPAEGVVQHHADAKGLLEYLGLSSKDKLDEQLRVSVRNILDPKSEKKNVRYLKPIRHILSDEARAYRVGGQAAKEYLDLQKGSTMSEMTAELYGATADVVKKEIKAQRIKRLRRLLGLKVEDYEGLQVKRTVVFAEPMGKKSSMTVERKHTGEIFERDIEEDAIPAEELADLKAKCKKAIEEGKVRTIDLEG